MIQRLAGSAPTRSRAVVHDGLVFTVATADKKTPSLYEQTRSALAAIDKNLAEAGTNKSRILSATVYITKMADKPEMNRAWDEWVDVANPPQRACIGAALEDGTLVEILVTAAQ
jgi:enamine deaminase RidA (YjgF/YER057c/UK114 family)